VDRRQATAFHAGRHAEGVAQPSSSDSCTVPAQASCVQLHGGLTPAAAWSAHAGEQNSAWACTMQLHHGFAQDFSSGFIVGTAPSSEPRLQHRSNESPPSGVAARARRPHLQAMRQLSLLDAGAALVDHPSARIEYWPGVCDAATADAWFDALLQLVPWRVDRRLMYERDVAVPRLLAHYALADDDVPAPIRAAREAIARYVEAPFTSVGLNLYRDGGDSVAMHHDRLAELVPGQPIALLSLGAPRRMTISTQAPPRTTRAIELQPGSLLVMNYDSQLHTLHGIPKTRAPVGPRISLAFRVRPA